MSKKIGQHLEEDIINTFKIFYSCKENFLCAKYLYSPETDAESAFISKSLHLQFIRFSVWKIAIIELNKITNESERYNISSLLKRIVNEEYKNHNISKTEIDNWLFKLSLVNDTIKEATLIRHQLYAHTNNLTDEFMEKYFSKINLTDIGDLIFTIEVILKEISLKGLDTDLFTKGHLFENDSFGRIILKPLAKEKQERIKSLADSIINKTKTPSD